MLSINPCSSKKLSPKRNGTQLTPLYLRQPQRQLLIKAGAYLLKNPSKWEDGHFFYMNYFCTRAMYQLCDDHWKEYCPKAQELLLSHQQADGSWGIGNFDKTYGLAYCTSMAVLTLTTEY